MGKICGVMRVEKRKRNDVYGLQEEANRTLEDHLHGREFDRSDIDWSLTEHNQHLIYTKNWGKEITRQIKEAELKEIMRGKNASVVMLDGLYTASSEWFDQHTPEEQLQYFNNCLDFHVKHYCGGDSSRVINAVIHYDETTPHMQVASVPIINNGEKFKLSAKDIMGNKKDYRRRQDLFFEEVTQHYEMERGEVLEEGEIRLHTTKREWQIATQEERLQQATQEVNLQEKQIEKNAETIKKQEVEIKQKQEEVKNQPHVLSRNEIEKLSEDARPMNKLTGKVALPQEEYQSLLATQFLNNDLIVEKRKLEQEKERLKRERQYFEIAKEDALEAARQQGLYQGEEKKKELIRKGQAFNEMLTLINENEELSKSFQRALKPQIKKYPLLVEAIKDAFDWVKEMVKNISIKGPKL